jgi:RNA polymerase sigma factor (TIGR02999 family)
MGQITALLGIAQHDDKALNEIVRLLYSDLERLTTSKMRRFFGDRVRFLTQEASELVAEAIIRLVKKRTQASDRNEFMAITTKLVTEVILDYRRKHFAQKRGGSAGRGLYLGMNEAEVSAPPPENLHLIEHVQTQLQNLEKTDPLAAEVATMRLIFKLEKAEIMELTEKSAATIDRAWKVARLYLETTLKGKL